MQQCSNFFAMEAIASLSCVLHEHRAGCCLPPSLLLCRRNQSPDAVRSKNPSKSTLAHAAVAAAVSHKHHSIICVSAGLIQPEFDWCWFYYFVRNGLVALLEATSLCAWIFSLDLCILIFSDIFFGFLLCVCRVSNKAFLQPLSTRLLCLVLAIPLVCWLYMRACVHVHVRMCR